MNAEELQAQMNVYAEARASGLTTRSFPDFQILLEDKNKKGQQIKIVGTQHRYREEKVKPKLTIRNPLENWKKKQKTQTPR